MTGIPAFLTPAMKAALRARGFTDEEITQLEPERASEILSKPDQREVREFIDTIIAQARAATKELPQPGLLQMLLVHPLDDGNVVPYRYALDYSKLVERMTSDAISASTAGHNVYIEGRTVRGGLNGKQRGGLADTVAVFALVVDSDADKGAAWTPTVPASLAVETSPGNAHFWFFFDRAVDLTTGQVLGERLRAATNADSDTGNVCQPYRVAGTVNYPGKKKRERGRSVTWTRSLGFDPETLWTPERLEQEFPATTNGKGAGEDGGAADEAGIPADTLRAIRNGVDGKRDRSFVFFNVMVALKRLGFTVDGIVDLLDRYPDGIAKKYEGRLRQEVERVYLKIKVDAGSDAGARKSVVMSCAEDLRTMTFNPLKYPVPGIFVEGLTVLAGKPKIGKSWFLLHAAIAVARGGFTLGNLHCIEGDVLYCALEDNARRMQSRMTKLLGISQPWPKRLTLCYDLPRLGEGGAEAIRDWILSVPNPRMVAIDTLAMIRALKKVDESNYQSDYLALIDLRALANEFGIALPVSHHLRKAEADDPFDTISGTLGLTGAVDSMLVLKRSVGGGSNYVLHGKGRDLVEIEKAMEFDRESCLWRIAGDAAPIRRSAERTAILDAIAEAGEPIGPNDIATATGMKATNVRFLLGKLVKEGVIKKAERGRYQPQT